MSATFKPVLRLRSHRPLFLGAINALRPVGTKLQVSSMVTAVKSATRMFGTGEITMASSPEAAVQVGFDGELRPPTPGVTCQVTDNGAVAEQVRTDGQGRFQFTRSYGEEGLHRIEVVPRLVKLVDPQSGVSPYHAEVDVQVHRISLNAVRRGGSSYVEPDGGPKGTLFRAHLEGIDPRYVGMDLVVQFFRSGSGFRLDQGGPVKIPDTRMVDVTPSVPFGSTFTAGDYSVGYIVWNPYPTKSVKQVHFDTFHIRGVRTVPLRAHGRAVSGDLAPDFPASQPLNVIGSLTGDLSLIELVPAVSGTPVPWTYGNLALGSAAEDWWLATIRARHEPAAMETLLGQRRVDGNSPLTVSLG